MSPGGYARSIHLSRSGDRHGSDHSRVRISRESALDANECISLIGPRSALSCSSYPLGGWPVNARSQGDTAVRRQPAPALRSITQFTRKRGYHKGNDAAPPCPNAWRCSFRNRFAWPNCNGSVVRSANQRFACAVDTPHHGIFQMPPPASLSNRGSLPPPASPGFRGTTGPSAALPARPAPRGVPVGACHASARTSRVAPVPLFHACRRHYPGGTDRCMRRSLPGRWRPSP